MDFLNGRLNELERKDLARRYLDAAEAWLRRLIDVELTAAHGPGYLADGAAGTGNQNHARNGASATPRSLGSFGTPRSRQPHTAVASG